MTNKKTVEEKLEELGQAIGSDDSLVRNVVSRIDAKPIGESNRIGEVTNKLNVNRLLTNRFTKLAATAVIIIAVFVGIYHFTGSFDGTTPAYGITDVPKLLRNIKTLHIKGWSTYYPKEQEPVSYPVEYWIDFENRCFRNKGPEWKISSGSYSCALGECILDDEYQMFVDHTRKVVTFVENTPLRQRLFISDKYYKNDRFLREFYLESDQLDDFKMIAQEQINGMMFNVWENDKDGRGIVKFWLSPSTGKLGRYYVRYRHPIESDWSAESEWAEYTISIIDRNLALPTDIFELERPPGYTVKHSKETAPKPELLAGGNIKIDSFNLKIHIVCTLSDGSVIIGWSGRNNEALTSQADLFENLERGGPLPKLTFELYALHPYYGKGNIDKTVTYIGRHLAHTQKENTYYEWSIYLPDSRPLKSNFKMYNVLLRSNPEDINRRRQSMVDSHVTIASAEDFDTFVRGAMSELSDDGKAPENITYERVLRLAEQIRESLVE